MSDKDVNPLNTGDKKNRKSNTSLIPIVLAIFGILIAAGGNVYNYLNAENQRKSIIFAVNKKFTENDTSSEFNAEQINAISVSVLETLRPELATLINVEVSENVNSRFDALVKATTTEVMNNLPPQPKVNSGLTEAQVQSIVEAEFKNRAKGLNALISNKLKEMDSLKQEQQTALENLEKTRKKIENLKYQIVKQGNDNNDSVVIKRQRLKEFKLVSVLKNESLFVVDAPKRDGKDNTITLTIGERFFSKFGRHKVEKIIRINDKPRLLISGGWFIDDIREELSEEEIKLYAEKLAARKSKKNRNKNKAEVKNKKVELRVAKTKEKEKVYLTSWKIITPIKEQQRVVALDGNSNKLVHLKMNQYVTGLGTVRNIDYSTGETCTEKYCIAGVNFK
ncbi:hypothetical protein ACTFQF_00870 [Aliivibrio fischeri]|uniref:Uncharacterized protein n=1 Tax=Aliivibrio fischeri (strain MJ11) TaxID=388396 RepID=B5EW71_ALIFM|nr:hypothetical protein [Aliivibrio fischeri]ACH64651.1 hypothetical protein VFMJ11_B0128 [Aliivibrio fischeri MJ11]MUK37603.1 hypothetical protein [Aliivibrio fischeri]